MLACGYNRLLRTAFGVGFSDAQCGFKAISPPAARALLPLVEDNHWFFGTELIVIAAPSRSSSKGEQTGQHERDAVGCG